MRPKILVLSGPTASGKTRLAVELAHQHNGEVVSADSMQIYRRMDIGTAKPSAEEMQGIAHHMLDVAEPDEDFSVARYVEMASACVDDILARGKLPIVAGGTGLYIDSLLSGRTFAPFPGEGKLRQQLEQQARAQGISALHSQLAQVDPEAAQRLHLNDEKRIIRALEVWLLTGKTITQHNRETQSIPPRYDALTITLNFADRQAMWDRINLRVDYMMADGLANEVKALLDSGIPEHCTAMQAIGYKELTHALRGTGSLSDAAEEIKLRSRQYAKRQLTWFRRTANAKWITWGPEIDFDWARRTSTECMEYFGLV